MPFAAQANEPKFASTPEGAYLSANQNRQSFGRPLYLAIACCILSGVEVAILYLFSGTGGQLAIMFMFVFPSALLLCLPLFSVFTRSRAIGKGFVLYALAFLALSFLWPVLLSAFPHHSALAGSAARVCAEAAESLALSARVACLSQFSLAMLLINAIVWALPVALIEFVLHQYERRGPRASAADKQS